MKIIVSLILFGLAWKYSRKNRLWLFLSILFLLTLFTFIIINHFTGEGLNEATLFHFQYGLGGNGEYQRILAPAIAFLIISFALPLLAYKKAKHKGSSPTLILVIFAIGLLLPTDLMEPPIRDDFLEYYREPQITEVPEQQKNLVYIYAESLESTYLDQDKFPNLTPNLNKLAEENINFTDIRQVKGTGWTIGGMIATQCASPLFTPSSGNSMSGMDSFFQGATCIGDLLKEQNYYLSYFGGSKLDFAGKGKIYSSHGFDKVQGLYELAPQLTDSTYKTTWGLYDDSLFEFVIEEFYSLSAQDQPFGIFTLTLDSHGFYGHPSESCSDISYGDGEIEILNAVACSDHLISQLVELIQNSEYADNTLIVISSDHLAMQNGASKTLGNPDRRRNLFIIIDPSQSEPQSVKTTASMLDIGPTVLSAMGYEAELGLGRNLLTEDSIFSQFPSIRQMNAALGGWRVPIKKFWDFPNITQGININTDSITVTDRSFQIPMLIEVNSDLETIFKFEFDNQGIKNTFLSDYFQENKKQGSIWIRPCGQSICITIKSKKNLVTLDTAINIEDLPYHLPQNKILESLGEEALPRIAHAGGGYNEKTYTNSFEALNYNVKQGFTHFELDFLIDNNSLLCAHDWNNFEKIKDLYDYCTLDTLIPWLHKHPQTYIITDIKDDNIQGLEIIARDYPKYLNRFIPQIYQPENYQATINLGFEKIIWTLYRYQKNDILAQAQNMPGLFAITMPLDKAQNSLAKEIRKIGLPSYAHTINSETTYLELVQSKHIDEIYTDFLTP